MAPTHIIKGELFLIYDQIPGRNAQREGFVYLVRCDKLDFCFVIREIKQYISKLNLRDGDLVEFDFIDDYSPKFKKCKLLVSYCSSERKFNEPGRRILIHRGTSENWSENCFILIPKRFETLAAHYKKSGSFIGSCTTEQSEKEVNNFLLTYPGALKLSLIYRSVLNENSEQS